MNMMDDKTIHLIMQRLDVTGRSEQVDRASEIVLRAILEACQTDPAFDDPLIWLAALNLAEDKLFDFMQTQLAKHRRR